MQQLPSGRFKGNHPAAAATTKQQQQQQSQLQKNQQQQQQQHAAAVAEAVAAAEQRQRLLEGILHILVHCYMIRDLSDLYNTPYILHTYSFRIPTKKKEKEKTTIQSVDSV